MFEEMCASEHFLTDPRAEPIVLLSSDIILLLCILSKNSLPTLFPALPESSKPIGIYISKNSLYL